MTWSRRMEYTDQFRSIEGRKHVRASDVSKKVSECVGESNGLLVNYFRWSADHSVKGAVAPALFKTVAVLS